MQGVYKGVCTQLARFIRNMRETTIAEMMAHDGNGRCGASFHKARGRLCMPGLKPWALFALFVLVFPTGNAISERGCSAIDLPCLISEHNWTLRAGNQIGLCTFTQIIISIKYVLLLFNLQRHVLCILCFLLVLY
jgi:hypothetical protein